jgi:hypothetical protein
MLNVSQCPGGEIVYNKNLFTHLKQSVCQMGTNETCPPGNQSLHPNSPISSLTLLDLVISCPRLTT